METELLKKHIQKALNETAADFQKREDIICRFEDPVIAYVDAEDMRFDTFFANGLNDHPKKIYRPGKTIILHYTPLAEEIVDANEQSPAPTDEWVRGCIESLWLAMDLNRALVNILGGLGRLTSFMNTMAEWDQTACREPWSHKIAAVIGGLGETGPAGSLHVNGRYGGRVGGIITDGLYAEKAKPYSKKELADELEKYKRDARFDGPCSDEMIAECPGNAITKDGIDKHKCEVFCGGLNHIIPAPEVCGKCFRFTR